MTVQSFTAPIGLGGSGFTYTNDNNGVTGLGNGGFLTLMFPLFNDFLAVANYTQSTTLVAAQTAATNAGNSATAAAASATSALNAPGTSATTTTSITPASGSISFTLAQTGKLFSLGQTMLVASAAAPATKWIQGQITAFNSATGATTLSVGGSGFAGTVFSDGVVSLGSTAGVQSVAGLSGAVTAAALKAALAITVADITDYASDQITKANAAKGLSIAFATAL